MPSSPSSRAEVPHGYEASRGGWVTMIYFRAHEGTDADTIAVLARDGDRLLVAGEIIDVNHDDDSKPRSLRVVARDRT